LRFQLLVCAAVAMLVGSVADGPGGHSGRLAQSGSLDWRVAAGIFGAALEPRTQTPVSIAGTRG
jgi:hypothetical protein